MLRFDNPFDISKDGQNSFIDGIRIHIRQSDQYKQEIKYWIDQYINPENDKSNLNILNYAMSCLGIPDNELTVVDEHELLDWIQNWRV